MHWILPRLLGFHCLDISIKNMLYLLTEKQKKKVLAEYRLRLAIVTSIMFGFAGLVGIISLIPSYEFLRIKQNILKIQEQNISVDSNSNIDNLSKKIADISNKAALLNPISEPIYSSSIFLHLEKIAGQDTSIRQFQYTHFDSNISVQISGVSKNRDSLTKFINTLKKEPAFSGAAFPYGSLAKQDNLEYSLNLLVNLEHLKPIMDADQSNK